MVHQELHQIEVEQAGHLVEAPACCSERVVELEEEGQVRRRGSNQQWEIDCEHLVEREAAEGVKRPARPALHHPSPLAQWDQVQKAAEGEAELDPQLRQAPAPSLAGHLAK